MPRISPDSRQSGYLAPDQRGVLGDDLADAVGWAVNTRLETTP